MEQIIKDLKSALDKMNAKSDAFSDKTEEYDRLIVDLKKSLKNVEDRESAVLLKENKYKEYDDIENIRSQIKNDRAEITKNKSALDAEKKAFASEKSVFLTEKESLVKMISLYKQKIFDCDKAMQQLEEDRKNLEVKIVEDLTKKLIKK